MSLTKDDLQQISNSIQAVLAEKIDKDVRLVVREESKSVVSSELLPIRMRLDNMGHRVEALYNDVKDIYHMLSDLQKTDKKMSNFGKKDLEQKITATYREIIAIAKAEGITLPANS